MQIADTHPQAQKAECADDSLVVSLVDGRVITVPLEWFPRLASANKEKRAIYEILGDGEGIHWPEVDEDISVQGLLKGTH